MILAALSLQISSPLRVETRIPIVAMGSLDGSLSEFREHHRNRANLVFHILCGFIYIGCFLSIFYGFISIPVYTILLVILFPQYLVINIMIGIGLFGVHIALAALRIRSWFYKALIAAVFYMAPEISHVATKERTVLAYDSLTIGSILENFFLLLPYSMYSAFGGG